MVLVTTVIDEVVAEPVALVAVTVKVALPDGVGVPDNTPAEDRLRPEGSVPDARV